MLNDKLCSVWFQLDHVVRGFTHLDATDGEKEKTESWWNLRDK